MATKVRQGDLIDDNPQRLAQVWRAAAETALLDLQFSEAVRQRRHDYYMAEALRLEALAGC